MKRTLLSLFTILMFVPGMLHAQRYLTEMFSTVSVQSNVVYGENYSVLTGTPTLQNLTMDVYTPDGDTATDRYVIILAHAGSFLPKGTNTLPLGDKNDSAIVEMCTQFAKRGWVAVSMNYRLGWNPTPDILGGDQETRASTIINAVYRAMQDMKTCIRFMRKDHANGNNYGIDPTRIALGGSNSGGYAALAAGALDDVAELNLVKFLTTGGDPYVDVDVTGGFEGEGGVTGVNMVNHEGYASNPQLILNMGGAMGDSSWIEAGEAPVVNFHGVADALTPYKTSTVIVAATGDPIVEVSGSFVIAQENDAVGNSSVFVNATTTGDPDHVYTLAAQGKSNFEGLYPFEGAANGFEPWAWYDSSHVNTIPSDSMIEVAPNVFVPASGFGSAANPFANKPKALAYIDTIMGYFNPRAIAAFANPTPLDPALSVRDLQSASEGFSIYPNPVTDRVIVVSQTSDRIKHYTLLDITGKIVDCDNIVNNTGFEIQRGNIPPGIYLLHVDTQQGRFTKKLIFK